MAVSDLVFGRVRRGLAAGASLIAAAGLVAAPTANADPLDNLRGAVNGARAQSTCPALSYNGQLESAAQKWVRTAMALGSINAPDFGLQVDEAGYAGDAEGSIASGDPTADATNSMMGNAYDSVRNCSLTEFGVGMARDEVIETSYVAVVFGTPPAPEPEPEPEPEPVQPTEVIATVVGGPADVYNIAHNDVPDPTNGVVGVVLMTLPEGSQVTLAQGGPCTAGGWCKIHMPDDPQYFGFIFGQLSY